MFEVLQSVAEMSKYNFTSIESPTEDKERLEIAKTMEVPCSDLHAFIGHWNSRPKRTKFY